MKFKSLMVLSVLAVGSLSAGQMRQVDFSGVDVLKLTAGIHTGIMGNCPRNLDNQLTQAISLLRVQRIASSSVGTTVAALLGEQNSKNAKRNWSDIKVFINSGQKDPSNSNHVYLSFVNNLSFYPANKNKVCIRLKGVKVNGSLDGLITAKELLTEVVKRLD